MIAPVHGLNLGKAEAKLPILSWVEHSAKFCWRGLVAATIWRNVQTQPHCRRKTMAVEVTCLCAPRVDFLMDESGMGIAFRTNNQHSHNDQDALATPVSASPKQRMLPTGQ
jgi:hypothetical protein